MHGELDRGLKDRVERLGFQCSEDGFSCSLFDRNGMFMVTCGLSECGRILNEAEEAGSETVRREFEKRIRDLADGRE